MRIAKVVLSLVLLGGLTMSAQNTPPAAKPATTITVEMLEARITELKAQEQQALGTANAADGAIQDAQHWIDILKTPPAKPAAPSSTVKPESPKQPTAKP